MEEWTSHNSNPSNIWKSLKKDNPNLDEQFFRLPNGGWDITRLNQAINEKNELSQKIKQEENEQLAQATFLEKQRKTLTRELANEEIITSQPIALGLFVIPAFLQLMLLLYLSFQHPLTVLAILIYTNPILILLNLVMLISVLVMIHSVSKNINMLDQRTRNFE